MPVTPAVVVTRLRAQKPVVLMEEALMVETSKKIQILNP
jgi:hypothetical protein